MNTKSTLLIIMAVLPQLALAQSPFEPVGNLIQVTENLQLHAYTKGTGKYTIIFTSGFGSPSAYTDFFSLSNNLSQTNKIFVYDRSGEGWSSAPPMPFKLEETANNLEILLQKTQQKPPYILVAHSFGALEMLHFASKHSNQVAGIVLIDGVSPQTYKNFNPEKSLKTLTMVNKNRWLFKFFVNMGLIGEVNKRKKLLPKDLIKLDRALLKKNFANATMLETAKQAKKYAEIVKEEVAIKDIPLLVLSCKDSFTELGFNYTNWEADQKYLVALSQKSKQAFLEGTHSTVHLTQSTVIETFINEFIDSLR